MWGYQLLFYCLHNKEYTAKCLLSPLLKCRGKDRVYLADPQDNKKWLELTLSWMVCQLLPSKISYIIHSEARFIERNAHLQPALQLHFIYNFHSGHWEASGKRARPSSQDHALMRARELGVELFSLSKGAGSVYPSGVSNSPSHTSTSQSDCNAFFKLLY